MYCNEWGGIGVYGLSCVTINGTSGHYFDIATKMLFFYTIKIIILENAHCMEYITHGMVIMV